MASAYFDLDELKTTLSLTTTDWDDLLQRAIEAASGAINERQDTVYNQGSSQSRVYTPSGPLVCVIDDFATITAVKVDLDDDGTHEAVWAVNTHYVTFPENAALRKRPFQWLKAVPHRSGLVFPRTPQSVQVTGKPGWPVVPPQVVEATGLLAAQIWKRRREVPFGVLGLDQVTASRVLRYDPHLCALLDELGREELVA